MKALFIIPLSFSLIRGNECVHIEEEFIADDERNAYTDMHTDSSGGEEWLGGNIAYIQTHTNHTNAIQAVWSRAELGVRVTDFSRPCQTRFKWCVRDYCVIRVCARARVCATLSQIAPRRLQPRDLSSPRDTSSRTHLFRTLSHARVKACTTMNSGR